MLGDIYTDWATAVKQAGGSVSSWPFSVGFYAEYFGRPAARFTKDQYVAASRTRLLDFSQPQQANAANTLFYVLAPQAVADTPQAHTMTLVERAKNAAFTAGDTAADTFGLPSLADIQKYLKTLGTVGTIAAVGAVAFFVLPLLKRGGRR